MNAGKLGCRPPGTVLPSAAVAAIAETIFQVLDLFGVFGNGHPYIPSLTRFELAHQGGSPAALGGLIGMCPEWAPGQRSLGHLQFVQATSDKTYGLPSDFWHWYHRKGKRPGDPDINNRADALAWYNEWLQQGKPDAEGHRTVDPNTKIVPAPVPEILPPPGPVVQDPLGDPFPVFEF